MLGADEPLGHRGRGHDEGASDLVGFQAAQRAQRERDLGVVRERGMAAGEDQPEAIVGDLARVVIRLFHGGDRSGLGLRFQFLLELGAAADAVDGLVPRGLDDPGAGRVGDAGDPPLVERGCKGFLRSLFGQVEVAKKPDQRGDDPAPVGAIDRVDRRVGVR